MPFQRGNQLASREGESRLVRIRLSDPADFADIELLDTYERGLALIGYLMWKESPEYDEHSFRDWIKKHTDYGQYD